MPNVADGFPGWADLRRRVPLWVLLAVLVTAWSIQFSLARGRLLLPPVCDDVGYFLEGLDWMEQCRFEGCAALARLLVERPPHSPFATLLALLSFGVCGV